MPESHENPLLDLGYDIPFDRIRGEHVEPAVKELVAEARARLDALAAEQGPRTFENTITALERATEQLDFVMGVVGHLESVATTPELRAAYSAVQPEVSEFFSSIALSEPVWNALKAYAATDEAKALTGTRKRLLEKTIADFKRSGADLDPDGKKRLAEIDVELAQLTLRYGQNVLDSTNAFELVIGEREALSGLPEGAVLAAKASAEAKGLAGYRFTMQAPSYLPVMTYLDDRSVRERMYRAYATRATEGPWDNRPLVQRILVLRREKARLLGFDSFADLVLEDRMAKSGHAARRFVQTLRDKTQAHFDRENADLAAFRKEIEGPDAPPIEPWDVGYYAEKLRRARYDFDEESLRPYFSADKALEGVFAIASSLYGVRIEPSPETKAWHASVSTYRIVEPKGHASAVFYVDLWPRESKRDGAWMQGLVTGVAKAAAPASHIEVLAGNLTPPIGDRPALLNHREVETLFHEFGHLMHHASSCVEVRTLAGTNVAWDFVELPSQIMENWCWEKEALDLFARHHETDEPIPAPLLERMRAARTFRAANAMMRQLGFAEVDLALHVDWDPARDGDPTEYGRAILSRHSPAALPSDHAMLASFSHLFSSPVGYAAGYYSYKWAEVLDADAFSRFKREGLFSREVGEAFRSEILARGDSEDPMVLYRRFMGREPTLEALLERDGLIASGTAVAV
ncbi:M3 family metallopeptidase [Polyangium sp. 6x1]|uniref:M3 family metallopeptidase n=1 Tax=Polyangium sp. 6x1 TaxID=3042689 RepID=UPI0024821905|nr:M3 family metallopeptidase [Polyangium sp. 6x1]MDI1443451.1 M3 family metallopeptidase [Polyangium sp. 6x1]